MSLCGPRGAGISCLRLISDGPAVTFKVFTSLLTSVCTMIGSLAARIRPFLVQWSAWSGGRSCLCIQTPCTTSTAVTVMTGTAAVVQVTSSALPCVSPQKQGT